MSTIKITQLVEKTDLNSNTTNTIFVGVDIPTGITSKYTATTISRGLYMHNPLNVGNKSIILPNTVAQFANTSNNYIQINFQNENNFGTADYVVTANTGTDTTYYIDLGYTNSAYDRNNPYNSLGTSIYPLDGYLYTQGSSGQPGGNLVLGTTSTGTQTRIVAGGVNSENVSLTVGETNITLGANRNLIFGDGSTQSVAAVAPSYSYAAYAEANTVASNLNANVVYFTAVNLLQNTNITNVNTFAQASFNKANNALANTTGIFGGDLTIAGNLKTTGFISLNNASIVDNTAFVSVIASTNATTQSPSNPGYIIHVTGIDGIGSRIVNDSFGSSANGYSGFINRRGRGTAQTPTALQTGDIIARFGGNGYGGSKFSQYADARIDFVTTQNFTDSNKGTEIQFWSTKQYSNVSTNIATFNGNTAVFTGTVSPEKGFIFTPKILLGAQTAITVDFATDSMIKGTYSSTVTISFANYTYGKVVEMWMVNTAVNKQTIIHGCAANNSTVGATSVSVSPGACAYLRYFSIDGDLANTFVSISYS